MGEAIAALAPEDCARLAQRLTNWTDPVSYAALVPWTAVASLGSSLAQVCVQQVAATQLQTPLPDLQSKDDPPVATQQHMDLRGLVRNVPVKFRCRLDGKLLMDPVIS